MNEEPKEEFTLSGAEIKDKIKKGVDVCNSRRIVVTNEQQEVIFRLSLCWAVLVAIILPWLVVIGLLVVIIAKYTVKLVKN